VRGLAGGAGAGTCAFTAVAAIIKVKANNAHRIILPPLTDYTVKLEQVRNPNSLNHGLAAHVQRRKTRVRDDLTQHSEAFVLL
jgi:hypothetical protein